MYIIVIKEKQNEATELKMFLDINLKEAITECIDGSFDIDCDPEISWELLRGLIKDLKKKHCKLYVDYMNTDDDELYESEIGKHRRLQEKSYSQFQPLPKTPAVSGGEYKKFFSGGGIVDMVSKKK